MTVKHVRARPRTVEMAFSAAPMLLLCVGDTCRRVATLLPQDEILWQPCLETNEELLPCLRIDRSVRLSNHANIWLYRQPVGMSTFLESGTFVAKMAPGEVSVRTRKQEDLRHPCGRSQTEVVAPRHLYATVHDVKYHVRGILRTLCTKADSGKCVELC